ncbi:hypothetical protein C8J57DRAFT_1542295 [Mycena rebaudengoi]|nr:hypothetical protein C8J57DRAFT_1542295 [Mycena rebaudengoi]
MALEDIESHLRRSLNDPLHIFFDVTVAPDFSNPTVQAIFRKVLAVLGRCETLHILGLIPRTACQGERCLHSIVNRHFPPQLLSTAAGLRHLKIETKGPRRVCKDPHDAYELRPLPKLVLLETDIQFTTAPNCDFMIQKIRLGNQTSTPLVVGLIDKCTELKELHWKSRSIEQVVPIKPTVHTVCIEGMGRFPPLVAPNLRRLEVGKLSGGFLASQVCRLMGSVEAMMHLEYLDLGKCSVSALQLDALLVCCDRLKTLTLAIGVVPRCHAFNTIRHRITRQYTCDKKCEYPFLQLDVCGYLSGEQDEKKAWDRLVRLSSSRSTRSLLFFSSPPKVIVTGWTKEFTFGAAGSRNIDKVATDNCFGTSLLAMMPRSKVEYCMGIIYSQAYPAIIAFSSNKVAAAAVKDGIVYRLEVLSASHFTPV